MSGLITSYFIDPVVRQARRFGNTPTVNSKIDSANIHNDNLDNTLEHRRMYAGLCINPDDRLQHHNNDESCSCKNVSANAVDDLAQVTKVASYYRGPLPITSLGRAIYDRFAPYLSNTLASPAHSPPTIAVVSDDTASCLSSIKTTSVLTSATLSHPVRPTSSPAFASVPTSQIPIAVTAGRDEQDDMPANLYSRSLPRRFPSNSMHTARMLSDNSASSSSVPTAVRLLSDVESRKPTNQVSELDNHKVLRQKIMTLWKSELTTEEKARQLHYLMNEAHYASRANLERLNSPERVYLHDRPPSLYSSALCDGNSQLSNPYNIQPHDLHPSYRPECETIPGTPNEELGLMNLTTSSIRPNNINTTTAPPVELEPEFGCVHYKRNIKVQCFACKTWWPCRLCHDEAGLGHDLPRHLTENMLCMFCKTPGPAGQYCKNCFVSAAHYYCEVCKLWDDSNRSIYHCSDCGICRLGEGIGKDYEHCKKCNVCIAIGHHTSHKCIERALECDCPICGSYMFNSSESAVALPCGHYLHRGCYDEYIVNAYQCPVCKKSAINMELHWRKLEDEIASQPMPSRWRGTIVEVRCNDCGGKSRCFYHWLGCRCGLCDSFNTVEVQVIGRQNENGLMTLDASNTSDTTSMSTSVSTRANTTSTSTTQTISPSPRRSPTVAARARGYFQEDEAEPERLTSILTDSGLSAYEMFSRMTRGLSPLRRYFDPSESNGTNNNSTRNGPATEAELEALGFWSEGGGDEERNNDNNEDDDDDDYYDEDESDDDSNKVDDDDEDSDNEEAHNLNLSLIGHR